MILVWIGVALVALKLAQIGPVGELAWWWVVAPFGLALIWFEWGERILGRDRRKLEHEEHSQRRKERLEKQFGPAKGGRPKR